MKINKGDFFLVSEGEYSYYHPIVLCQAIDEIDIKEQQVKWLELHPEQKSQHKFLVDEFVKWLIEDSGLMKKVECKEWHLGSYDSIDFSDGIHRYQIGYEKD